MATDALLDELTQALVERAATTRPLVVGITGSVAVGKSSLAELLRAAMAAALPSASVEVVSTDSFLFPNDVLAQSSLLMRKGFPESFDMESLAAFLQSVRAGADGLSVPIYDHFVFDIVDGKRRDIGSPDVLIIEGVVLPDGLDVSIYLDADVADIERWFTDRFAEQVALAAESPGGFYDLFAGMTEAEVRDAAAWTWREINLPNLVDHIAPTRASADLILTKSPDHSLKSITLQT